jgi:hypothetical protein
MEKKINLDEFIPENMDVRDVYYWGTLDPEIKQLLKIFGKQLLQLAAENAMVSSKLDINGKQIITENIKFVPHPCDKSKDVWTYANKQSILDTIKQVE